MRQIAKETGISIGALYHYFPDKEAIGEQLFQHAARRFAVDAAQQVQPHMDRTTRLEALQGFIQQNQADLTRVLLLGIDHHRLYPDGRDVTQGTMRSFKAILTAVIGLEANETELLFTLLCGVLVRSLLDPEDVHLREQLTVLS